MATLGATTTPNQGFDRPGGAYAFASSYTTPAGSGIMVTAIYANFDIWSGSANGTAAVWDGNTGAVIGSGSVGALTIKNPGSFPYNPCDWHHATPDAFYIPGSKSIWIGGWTNGDLLFESESGGSSNVKAMSSFGSFAGSGASPIGTAGAYIVYTAISAPTISSVTPNFGTGGTSLAIVGTGFTYLTGLTVNGAAASFTINSDTSLTATVPTGAAYGNGNVVATNPAGSSAGFAFFAGSAPTISSASPATGVTGTVMTLTGTKMLYVTAADIDGTTATFSVTNDTTMTVTVPAGLSDGSHTIHVTNPAGTGSLSVYIGAAPTITTDTPVAGPIGSSIALVGTAFSNVTSATVGGASATFSITSNTAMAVTVPSGAAYGPGTVTVTNPAGTGSKAFTVGGIARGRRSGAWVIVTPKGRRSGAWVSGFRARGRRSGAWNDTV